jgi:hypothetical protein
LAALTGQAHGDTGDRDEKTLTPTSRPSVIAEFCGSSAAIRRCMGAGGDGRYDSSPPEFTSGMWSVDLVPAQPMAACGLRWAQWAKMLVLETGDRQDGRNRRARRRQEWI